MKKRIVNIFLPILLMLLLPTIVNASEQIYVPNNWNCFFDQGNLRCMSSATQEVDIKKYDDNVYCALGYDTCWEINTGLAWFWMNSENPIWDPDLKQEEDYDVTYWDVKSNFKKYASYYYADSELKPEGKVIGVWEYDTTTSGTTCPTKNGLVGNLYEEDGKKHCLYSQYVGNLNNGKCSEISGVSGSVQTFLNLSYCIYNLYYTEDKDCSKSGGQGVYLDGYQACIINPLDSGTNEEYNGNIRCFDADGKGYDPDFLDDGAYNNLNHYYFFCPVNQEILGNLSTCIDPEFLDESEVINRFGVANQGYRAVYCKTAIGFDAEIVPDEKDNIYGDTDEPIEKVETNDSFWGNLPVVKCGNTEIPEPIPPITRIIVLFIKIAAPLVLIIMGMIDIVKAVTASDEKKIKEAQTKFVKRLIPAAAIFLVVTIIQLLIGILADNEAESGTLSKCIDCMISDKNACVIEETVNN